VWIDPLKHIDQQLKPLQTITAVGVADQGRSLHAMASLALVDTKPRKQYARTHDALTEQPIAAALYAQGKQLIEQILQAVNQSGEIDVVAARRLVSACMQSILRNPDALLWMHKIRTQDAYTAEHSLNVSILAMVFGRHLGMSETEIARLGLCGLLHDVGKVFIPQAILTKPSPLSVDEFDVLKTHTMLGYLALTQSSQFIPPIVAEVAKSHHERADAFGYPHRTAAADLDTVVRMITLVDAYDAITADRHYATGRSNTEALKIIYDQKAKQFDEALALEFISCIGVYPAGSLVKLNNGLVGIVVEVNPRYRHLPLIMIVRDAQGNVENPHYVNLLECEFGDLPKEYLVQSTLPNHSLNIDISHYAAA
jgi:HD-GYP domain-containing protein (c-di-GMP phosphodiesterase class II)